MVGGDGIEPPTSPFLGGARHAARETQQCRIGRDLAELLRPYTSEEMRAYQVSTAIS